jgi:hypothetical protein
MIPQPLVSINEVKRLAVSTSVLACRKIIAGAFERVYSVRFSVPQFLILSRTIASPFSECLEMSSASY